MENEKKQLKKLPPAAERALQEAEERRAAERANEALKSDQAVGKKGPRREYGGRGGPDPVRFGDWEKKGIASDF